MSIRHSLVLAWIWCLLLPALGSAEQPPGQDGEYSYHEPSRDGIGKRYFGREIARIMGHQGAAWLERRTRASEELPDKVVEAMELAPDAKVADIGAGTGYFSFRLAESVPTGQVYAVDVQQEMLDILHKRIQRRSIGNIVPVMGMPDDPRLPDGTIDAVLLVDAYHEFACSAQLEGRHAIDPIDRERWRSASIHAGGLEHGRQTIGIRQVQRVRIGLGQIQDDRIGAGTGS
jgi:SAM-dependent methyltransferase